MIHLCPASLNPGNCASIVFDAENTKSNSVTIGKRDIINGVTTEQNITQLYNTRPKGLLDLLDMYIIQFYLTLYVENFINRT